MALNLQVTPNTIAAADQIREDAANSYNQIMGMTELNDAARRQRLAKIYLAAKSTMATLQETSTDSSGRQWQTAMQTAFGTADLASTPAEQASLSMSYREALDRADTLDDPAAGQALFDRAKATADELLQRALAKRAYDMSGGFGGGGAWGGILEDYLSGRPKAAAAVDQLANLQAGKMEARNLFAFIVPKPSELSNLSDGQIAAVAAG